MKTIQSDIIMTKTTYGEKLLNPKWQKKRLEILSRDNFTCQLCSDEDATLHVHHKSYSKGCDPWEYDNSNFTTLCIYCHGITEEFKNYAYQLIECVFTKALDYPVSSFRVYIMLNNEGKKHSLFINIDQGGTERIMLPGRITKEILNMMNKHFN